MIIQLSAFRDTKPQVMSKRTFDASLKDVTKQIAVGKISPQDGYESIQRLINEYFFPEGR
jgi:hypothetical protein